MRYLESNRDPTGIETMVDAITIPQLCAFCLPNERVQLIPPSLWSPRQQWSRWLRYAPNCLKWWSIWRYAWRVRSHLVIGPNTAWGAYAPGQQQNWSNKARRPSTSAEYSVGRVPFRCWSNSGLVVIPCGHLRGSQRAAHLYTVRLNKVEEELTCFYPNAALNESPRWQTIWCSDILPQRAWFSGRREFSLARIAVRSVSSAKDLIARMNSTLQDR